MKITTLLFSLLMAASLFFAACNKDEDDGTDTPAATCTDGIQNGTETGVDCGGSCPACITGCGTVTDVDGNTYQTVQIGSQCWMKENLKTSKYNDNTPIPYQSSQSFWSDFSNQTQTAYCYPQDDPSKNATYGKFYNWFTVETGKVCPVGWHVPSQSEWTELINYLGGEDLASDKMRAVTTLWGNHDDATNSSGFSALPAGYRDNQGVFKYYEGFLGEAIFWSGDNYDTYWAYSGCWVSDGSIVNGGTSRKNCGSSIRCVKNDGSSNPTCTDGIQNGDEEGIDCGGSCPNACGGNCSDGIQNGDEEGIDCGGSACPDCTNNSMSAYINGSYWSTTDVEFNYLGQLKVQGNPNGGEGVTVYIDWYQGTPGDYDLGALGGGGYEGWGEYVYPGGTAVRTGADPQYSGEATVTSDNGATVTGTFYFTTTDGTYISSGQFSVEY